MSSITKEHEKQIFQKELYKLKKKELIGPDDYDRVLGAHFAYYQSHGLAEVESNKAEVPEKVEKVIKTPLPASVPEKPSAEPKTLSPEEMRERNISMTLNLGVVLLLVGGLFVATSNWDEMSDWMKSGSIALVSLLFFGISLAAGKLLGIHKTAFAFNVLGSLFLPIFLLSVSWFGLMGPYLSFYGEGNYFYAAAGALILAPFYGFLARKMDSGLFVWFAFSALTSAAGFLLLALGARQDTFYLGMMIYNAGLIGLFLKGRKRSSSLLFFGELAYIIQASLILSTVLMLAFYQNTFSIGVNMLLAAVLFMASVYVSGKKEYHFAFTLLVVMGVYQLTENSLLELFSPAVYAAAGAGFMFLPKLLREGESWEKIFNWTSAAVSLLVFLLISAEAVLAGLNDPSLAMLLAYLILSGQFLFLAGGKNGLFAYLSPVFLFAAAWELLLWADAFFSFNNFLLPVFLSGAAIYVIFGILKTRVCFRVIRQSSRDIGLAVMGICMLLSASFAYWGKLGVMLMLLSLLLWMSRTAEKRQEFKEVLSWAVPLSFALAFFSWGEWLRTSWPFYRETLGFAMNGILAAASLAAGRMLNRKIEPAMRRYMFFISQALYSAAVLSAIFLPLNEWTRAAVLICGIGIYYRLHKAVKNRQSSYLMPAIVFAAYFAILTAISRAVFLPEIVRWTEIVMPGIILAGISGFLKNKEQMLCRSFAWSAHTYLPFALALTWLIHTEHAFISLAAAGAVYWISSRQSHREWQKKAFLYSACFSLFLFFYSLDLLIFEGSSRQYVFMLSSFVIYGLSRLMTGDEQKRLPYYLVPFSLIGLASSMLVYPFGLTDFSFTVMYGAAVLYYLHSRNWEFLNGVPLVLIWLASLMYMTASGMEPVLWLLVMGGMGAALIVFGHFLYKQLYETAERGYRFDSYTPAGLLFFAGMYPVEGGILTEVLPGLLISLALWSQGKRKPQGWEWIPPAAGAVFLLQPYFALINYMQIPQVFIREAYVLPFIAEIILIRLILKGRFADLISKVQWAVLAVSAILLVEDALAGSTIQDALIIGMLSLLSIFGGLIWKIKSYFFTGFAVLLLNVLMQTRPFWGNLPWWAYLLIAGSLLIAAASYYEWNKQKTVKGETGILARFRKRIIQGLKNWK
ncbi:hypothetical protein LCM00_00450 [Bacillus infantis]|uniref:hypothetical protein n=1 Tax=Bacillus infantis TaxID=324767 RepID=UPI001CD1DF82|nr:hypothetical protein [Bacillus infantis]MCA1037962.1 hypothetical protein [Bacillus infantis]